MLNFRCNLRNVTCVRNMDKIYRYYASFENTLCAGYLTEKVSKVLTKNLIPLIYSGAKIEHFLPPKSYINVEDFGSIKNLTDYLNFLSKNPKEYIKYFWWKRYYTIERAPTRYCEICQLVHKEFKETKIYRNFQRWFQVFQIILIHFY